MGIKLYIYIYGSPGEEAKIDARWGQFEQCICLKDFSEILECLWAHCKLILRLFHRDKPPTRNLVWVAGRWLNELSKRNRGRIGKDYYCPIRSRKIWFTTLFLAMRPANQNIKKFMAFFHLIRMQVNGLTFDDADHKILFRKQLRWTTENLFIFIFVFCKLSVI